MDREMRGPLGWKSIKTSRLARDLGCERRRNLETKKTHHERTRSVISFAELFRKLSAFCGKKWVLIGVGFVAGLAVHTYYVQEILAGLILFSLLFVVAYAVALAVFFLARASKPVIAWAAPYAGRAGRWCVESAERTIASPVWARAVRRELRREHRKFNVKSKRVYLHFAGLKPEHVYGAGLRAGAAVRTIGVTVGRRVSSRLGPWLTKRIALRPLALTRRPIRLFARMRGVVAPHARVFATRRPKNHSN